MRSYLSLVWLSFAIPCVAVEHATIVVDPSGVPALSNGSAGFFLDSGSTTGEYPIRIGTSAADDAAGGVLINSASQLARNGLYATASTVPDGTQNASSSRGLAGALAVSATKAGAANPADAGSPIDYNLSSAYFSFADGWLGGTVSSSTVNSDGTFGSLDNLVASNGITLNASVQSDYLGQPGVNRVAIPGVTDANRQGILLATAASRVGRFTTVAPSLDGASYIVRTVDNDGFFEFGPELDPNPGGEADAVTTPYSFVFLPVGTPDITFARVATNGPTLIEGEQVGIPMVHSGADFTVRSNNLVAPGQFRLEIDGVTPADGTLIVTPIGSTEDPGGNAADNILTYEADATGWTLLSQDMEADFLYGNAEEVSPLDGAGQAANGPESYFSFAFIPNNAAISGPGSIPAASTLTAFNKRRVIGWNAEVTALSSDNGNAPGDVAAFVGGGGSQKTTDVRIDLFANRGDVNAAVDGAHLDTNDGLLLTTISEGLRNNTDNGGAQEYGVTMTTAFDQEWSVVTAAADNISGSDEHNINFSAAFFGADSGFRMAVGQEFDESLSFGDPYNTTKIDVDLAGVNALVDGVLIAAPFGNDDNFASATPKADGSGWEVRVFDNTYDAQTDLRTEPDAASWIFLPYEGTTNLFAAGLVDSDGTVVSSTDGLGTEWTLTKEDDGFGFAQYRLSFFDSTKNPENGMLLLTPTGDFDSQANNENRDNSMLYETDGNDFLIRGIDHISDGQTEAFVDFADTGFMFAYVDFNEELSLDLRGDYNGDGTVDAADYTVWRDNFGTASGATALTGDGDGDGDVDQDDYNVWARDFGRSGTPGARSISTSVPEPNALLLLTTAVSFVVGRRP